MPPRWGSVTVQYAIPASWGAGDVAERRPHVCLVGGCLWRELTFAVQPVGIGEGELLDHAALEIDCMTIRAQCETHLILDVADEVG